MTVSIVQAIARMEGFAVTHSRAQRNNNPGNIEFKSWMLNLYGARIETVPEGSSEQPRFAFFPDAPTGWRASAICSFAATRNDAGGCIQQICSTGREPDQPVHR